MNILILHNIADFASAARSTSDYVLCFERYAPEHRYLYCRITEPGTDALRDLRFDAIILDSSALGICRYRPRELWEAEKARWSFLADCDAVKIGLPQDDYHQSETLDALFDDWNFDAIYTVIPDRHPLLYPRSIKRMPIETVLTGYVDDLSIAPLRQLAVAFEARPFDIGQRVSAYSPIGGRHAQLKGRLAERLKDAGRRHGMAVDISTGAGDRILGDDWFRFLGRCRFVPGTESGVSIWDPDGAIHDRVEAYVADRPEATFQEVEAACFPNLDGQHIFTAVAPRLFESALMGCGQILVEAPYLGVLKPGEHYIAVRNDLGDIDEALDATRDVAAAKRRVAACHEALIENREFRYSHLVQTILSRADEVADQRHLRGTPEAQWNRLTAAHREAISEYRKEMAARGRRAAQSPRLSRLLGAVPASVAGFVPQSVKGMAKRVLFGNRP